MNSKMKEYSNLSVTDARTLFRNWREENNRQSSDIVSIWQNLLEKNASRLGNERHLILEQVIVAALDCAQYAIAEKCILTLTKEFPNSSRVQKYNVMLLEAQEMYDEALEQLEIIINRDKTNAAPRKRKVAILKARGETQLAIKELNDYLRRFMSDVEAWHELCNLYLAEAEYAKAVFCMEEVLLHNPHSHLIHQRIAEIRYTMGGLDNIEIAKTYYSQAVNLNPNNIRAFIGLYLCCCHIVSSKVVIQRRKEAARIAHWALDQVEEKTGNRSECDALENAFASLDIKGL